MRTQQKLPRGQRIAAFSLVSLPRYQSRRDSLGHTTQKAACLSAHAKKAIAAAPVLLCLETGRGPLHSVCLTSPADWPESSISSSVSGIAKRKRQAELHGKRLQSGRHQIIEQSTANLSAARAGVRSAARLRLSSWVIPLNKRTALRQRTSPPGHSDDQRTSDSRYRLRVSAISLVQRPNCGLCSVRQTQLLQDRLHMDLDRCFGNAARTCDHFVRVTFCQSDEDRLLAWR